MAALQLLWIISCITTGAAAQPCDVGASNVNCTDLPAPTEVLNIPNPGGWGLKWKITTGQNIGAPELNAEGTVVYFCDPDAGLSAVDTSNASAIWGFPAENCVDSSPALSADGATLYFGAGIGSDSQLYAVYSSNGTQKWAASSCQVDSSVNSSPVESLDGAVVFFGTDESVLCALHASNGTTMWNYTTGGQYDTFDLATPVLSADGAMLYFGSGDGLYAVHTSKGTKEWVFQAGNVDSTPALSPDLGVAYFGADDGLYAVHTSNGTEKWSKYTGESVSSPALSADGTVVYFTSHHNNPMCAVHASNGSAIWNFTEGYDGTSSPALSEDGAMMYFGSTNSSGGNLYAVHPSNGTKKWGFPVGAYGQAGPTLSADGTAVYFGSTNADGSDPGMYAVRTGVTIIYVCAKGRCVPATPGHPGIDRATCEATCIPPAPRLAPPPPYAAAESLR